MSDTTSEVDRQTSADAEVYRPEQILQRPARLSSQPNELQSDRRLSRGFNSSAEGASTITAEAQPSTIEQDERQSQVRHCERHV